MKIIITSYVVLNIFYVTCTNFLSRLKAQVFIVYQFGTESRRNNVKYSELGWGWACILCMDLKALVFPPGRFKSTERFLPPRRSHTPQTVSTNFRFPAGNGSYVRNLTILLMILIIANYSRCTLGFKFHAQFLIQCSRLLKKSKFWCLLIATTR